MTFEPVPTLEWAERLTDLRSGGWSTLETLTAIDRGEHLEVVVVLRQGSELRMVSTLVPADDPALPSAVGSFPAAAWLEREAAEMFGLVFAGHPDPRPLLLRQMPADPPLRRSTPLPERIAIPWPGAREPSQAKRARRRALPPGVRESWLGESRLGESRLGESRLGESRLGEDA